MGFMRHQHFKTISSTQTHLVGLNPTMNEEILISTEEQTQGTGQRQRAWTTFSDALAMSFTFRPNKVITLTALELGVLLCEFFKSEYQKEIFLKWPNDILNQDGNKLGGTLISKNSSGPCIVGMGINLSQKGMAYLPETDYPINGIFSDLKELSVSIEDFSKKLYTYFLTHRLESNEVIKKWSKYCLHLDKKIRFIENNEEAFFIFKGIGENGEALLEDTSHQVISKFSGSVRI